MPPGQCSELRVALGPAAPSPLFLFSALGCAAALAGGLSSSLARKQDLFAQTARAGMSGSTPSEVALPDYRVGERLGSGAFGSVYKVSLSSSTSRASLRLTFALDRRSTGPRVRSVRRKLGGES